MKRLYPFSAAALLAAVLAFTGCGPSRPASDAGGHDHGAPAAESAEAPAKFKEGHGLRLSPRTARAIGVETSEVEERAIAPSHAVTVAVFEAGPPARASALVSAELAQELEKHPPGEARLLSIRPHLAGAAGQAEVVFALPGTPTVGTTLTLTLRGPARTGVAVPRSALLRTATGTFVYVLNGSHLLRTPVRPGASDGAYHEILDGLYAGDVVATAAVEQLWLTELRLTKGGGHSH